MRILQDDMRYLYFAFATGVATRFLPPGSKRAFTGGDNMTSRVHIVPVIVIRSSAVIGHDGCQDGREIIDRPQTAVKTDTETVASFKSSRKEGLMRFINLDTLWR